MGEGLFEQPERLGRDGAGLFGEGFGEIGLALAGIGGIRVLAGQALADFQDDGRRAWR